MNRENSLQGWQSAHASGYLPPTLTQQRPLHCPNWHRSAGRDFSPHAASDRHGGKAEAVQLVQRARSRPRRCMRGMQTSL